MFAKEHGQLSVCEVHIDGNELKSSPCHRRTCWVGFVRFHIPVQQSRIFRSIFLRKLAIIRS